tara:strand:- start:987 stop:1193 length:207 start_codon:yes stop_codon:yes gene_type:complete
MRDHEEEPVRYYDWMLYKSREEDRKFLLDNERVLLLDLKNSTLAEKYPDLAQVLDEIIVAEKLTNEYT